MVQKYGKLIYGWDYSKDLIKPLLEKLGGEKIPPKDKNDLAIEYINQMLSDQYDLIEDRKLDKDYESDEELKESTESELLEIRNAQRYMDLQTEMMP